MIEQLPYFMKRYITHLKSLGRQQSTIKRYLYDLNDFTHWIQHKRKQLQVNWTEITVDELEEFFEELLFVRNYQVRTVRRVHSVLRQVSRFQRSIGATELIAMTKVEPPPLEEEPLSSDMWVTKSELKQLMKTLKSTNGLSSKQIETFPFYMERNLFIVILFVHYGLTIQEVHNLSIANISFNQNELNIFNQDNEKRSIILKQEDKLLAYNYLKNIPEPVRPRLHSRDPFFVAFDFQRKTFHWSYDDDQPKRMTIIAIQKMLRLEVQRARLRKGISAQTLRHTFILKQMLSGRTHEQIIEKIGYTSPLSMKRYETTIAVMTKEEKNTLL